VISTPLLPKPFKRVKSVNHSIVREAGRWDHGEYVVYLNPRGSMCFAVGLPAYVGVFMQSENGSPVALDKSGIYFVEKPTADEAIKCAHETMRSYEKLYALSTKQEIIAYSFEGLAPKFDEKGNATGDWVYKRRGFSTNQDETKIEFGFKRCFRIGDEHYERDAKGEFHRIYGGSSFIPYSDEVWDQLVAVRETLTKAVVSLGDLFDGKGDITKKLLGMRFPALTDERKKK
jgi:hypothetical protein